MEKNRGCSILPPFLFKLGSKGSLSRYCTLVSERMRYCISSLADWQPFLELMGSSSGMYEANLIGSGKRLPVNITHYTYRLTRCREHDHPSTTSSISRLVHTSTKLGKSDKSFASALLANARPIQTRMTLFI